MRHLLLLALFLCAPATFADSLDDAKAAGFVGERPDGLLGLVVSSAPDAVKALVQDINDKRISEYERIAKANKLTMDQVQQLAGKKVINKTEPGHWVLVNDKWVKK